MARAIVLSVIFGTCLVLHVAGFLGAVHPVGDALSILAPLFAVFGIAAGLALGGTMPRLGAAYLFVGLGLYVYDVLRTSGPDGDLGLYQKNLWYRNAELDVLAADILDSQADFVTLQEVSDRNRSLLDDLRIRFPYQHLCRFSGWSGVAVLSRFPFTETSAICSDRRALAAVEVKLPSGPAWVASVHLPWPYPFNQTERLASIEPTLASLEGPVLIGADFNTFPSTRVTKRIASLAEGQELRPLAPTFYLEGLPIILDHVVAPSGTLSRRPLLGSDHYGLLARVSVSAE